MYITIDICTLNFCVKLSVWVKKFQLYDSCKKHLKRNDETILMIKGLTDTCVKSKLNEIIDNVPVFAKVLFMINPLARIKKNISHSKNIQRNI